VAHGVATAGAEIAGDVNWLLFQASPKSAGSGRGLSACAARSIATSWSSPSFCPRSRNRLVNASIGGGRSPPSKRKSSYHKSLTLFRNSCRFASVALRRATARARRAFLHAAFQSASHRFRLNPFQGPLSEAAKCAFNFEAACLLQSLLSLSSSTWRGRAAIAVRMRAKAGSVAGL
jgi:hypothetical protein